MASRGQHLVHGDRRFATEDLQVARAQVIQLQTDLGDARQILADQAKRLQCAFIERNGGSRAGHEGTGGLAVLGHRAVSLQLGKRQRRPAQGSLA